MSLWKYREWYPCWNGFYLIGIFEEVYKISLIEDKFSIESWIFVADLEDNQFKCKFFLAMYT